MFVLETRLIIILATLPGPEHSLYIFKLESLSPSCPVQIDERSEFTPGILHMWHDQSKSVTCRNLFLDKMDLCQTSRFLVILIVLFCLILNKQNLGFQNMKLFLPNPDD